MKSVILAILLLVSSSVTAGDLKIYTGSEGGGYESLGKKLAVYINKQTKSRKAQKVGIEFDYEIVNSTGSGMNIEALSSGEAQIAIVQSDAMNVAKPTIQYKAKRAGVETVWWIYNNKNGFKDLEDIEGTKESSMVLVDGSGAVFTMQSFVQEDDGYKVNYDSAVYADDLYEAFEMVCEGKNNGTKISGLLYVGGSIPNEVRNDFSKCVSVGEATDSDFNDAKDINGDKLYTDCKIESNRYKPLSGASTFAEDTVCLNAMVVYTKEFEKLELKLISKGIAKALRGVK